MHYRLFKQLSNDIFVGYKSTKRANKISLKIKMNSDKRQN